MVVIILKVVNKISERGKKNRSGKVACPFSINRKEKWIMTYLIIALFTTWWFIKRQYYLIQIFCYWKKNLFIPLRSRSWDIVKRMSLSFGITFNKDQSMGTAILNLSFRFNNFGRKCWKCFVLFCFTAGVSYCDAYLTVFTNPAGSTMVKIAH